MNISAIIIAKNSAATIARALKSVAFTDEQLVIVDDTTTDDTVAIATKLGAKVHVMPWQGYGPQKNIAADLAKNNWLLFLDDDEEVTPALAQEIERVSGRETHSIYWLRIVTIFLGRPLKSLYGHNPRLFKKEAAHWNHAAVHEQLVRRQSQNSVVKLFDKDTGVITELLWHHSHPTIKSYLEKMHRYTTLDAAQMMASGHHRNGKVIRPRFWLPSYLATKQFVKLYLYRRGLLDGYVGLIWCLLSAYYEYEMGKKYLRLCA